MQKLLLVVLFLTYVISCQGNRIVGGREVNIAQHGWQVSVRLFGSHYCGGAIIHENWIATAGHCIETVNNADRRFSIQVGSSVNDKGGKVYKIKEAIIHPEYDTYAVDFDIALLRVEISIAFTACTVRPIQLVNEGTETLAGTMLTVSGWGSRIVGGDITTKLRAVDVPVIDQQVCNEYYAISDGITDNMLCAGYAEGGMDACQGDSGGPLVDAKRNLIGLVSWGKGCASSNNPGVYTNIAAPKIRQFIKTHTNL